MVAGSNPAPGANSYESHMTPQFSVPTIPGHYVVVTYDRTGLDALKALWDGDVVRDDRYRLVFQALYQNIPFHQFISHADTHAARIRPF